MIERELGNGLRNAALIGVGPTGRNTLIRAEEMILSHDTPFGVGMSVGSLKTEPTFAVRDGIFLSEREQTVVREMKVFMTRRIFIDSIFIHVIRRFSISEITH